MIWGVLLGVAVAVGVAWYLLIETEGVYLGRPVVIWLYDRFAGRYDAIKSNDPIHEQALLAAPLLAACTPHTDPMVLDIATGTARLPLTLCHSPVFDGQVVAIDLSRDMLAHAAANLAENLAYVDLLHTPAACLPFPDHAFDVVTLLEALEFTPSPQQTLAEALRVLRPGGIFLTTMRQNVRTMPGKLWSKAKMEATLFACGATAIQFEPWQHEYCQVWARKQGQSDYIGARPLETVLRCPLCEAVAFGYTPPHFICGQCGVHVQVEHDGVIAIQAVQRC